MEDAFWMAEESEDDVETGKIPLTDWLPPVASREELPETPTEGSLCYVQAPNTAGSGEIWQFVVGKWTRVQPR